MAEGGELLNLSAEEDMLCCSVCMEEYLDPRALPCLHTFCYRCLVQVTLKGTMNASPEMKLASYIGNLLSFRDKQSTLKCPLCSEEHPIPRDKGVGGFRKDFRINQLLEQRKTKRDDAKKGTDDDATKDVKPDVEKCQTHPDEKLLYHCENIACKSDICEKCWEGSHDKHNVILLSKKVKDAKSSLQQVVGNIVTQISSQIDILSKTERDTKEQYEKVENDLKDRMAEIQDKLQNSFDQSFLRLENEKKMQEKKISMKADDLRALQDTFKKIQDDLQTNTRAESSVTFNEYQLLQGQMKHLSADLDQWCFPYTAVSLPDYNFTNMIKRAALVTCEDKNLGKEKPDQKVKETGDQKEKGTEKHDTKQKTKEKQTQSTDAKDTAAKPKKKEAKTKGGEKDSNPTQKSKKAKADVKVVKAETVPKVTRPAEKPTQPAEPKISSVQSTSSQKEVKKLKLETSFRTKGTIESVAAAKDDVLYVTTNDHLSRYKTSPVKKDFQKDIFVKADDMVLTTSKSDKVELVVLLNSTQRTLSFYSLERISAFVNSLEKESRNFLASWGHFIAYVYNENNKDYVQCLTVENGSPVISSFGQPVQIPFESGHIKSMCLYASSKGNPVVTCTNTFTTGKSDKSDTALVTIVVTKLLNTSKWTFNELDPKASSFDLCNITCDKDSIFVLNKAANALYHVSKTGKSVRKVSVIGASFPFSLASHMCVDSQSNSLYIATDKNLISKFSY